MYTLKQIKSASVNMEKLTLINHPFWRKIKLYLLTEM